MNEILTPHFDNGDTVWLIGTPIIAPDCPECRVLVRLIDWELDDEWAATAYLIAMDLVPDEQWTEAAAGVGFTREEFDGRIEAERLEILADYGGGLAFWEAEGLDRVALLEQAQEAIAAARADLQGTLGKTYNRVGSTGWDEMRGDYAAWMRRRYGLEERAA